MTTTFHRALGVTAAAALALGLAAPAHAHADTFPATASSGLVALDLPGRSLKGSWAAVSVGEDVGAAYPSADFAADPDGIKGLFTIGGRPESRVNTTAAGNGRAEAKSALSGGFTLTLPGHTAPAVRFATLQNSIKCDFSGNLVWENKINGGPGENDRVVTVFGTPVTADAPEVTATVATPEGEAEVTVRSVEPTDATAGRGRVYTSVSAVVDGAVLFDLTLGDVAVDCLGGDDEETGEPPATEEPGGGEETPDPETPGGEETPAPETPETEEPPATDGPEKPGEQPTAPVTQPSDRPGTDGSLPVTGGALAGLVAAGVLALGGGGAAVYFGRRKRAADTARD
ncbi:MULTISPECIES: hypothetical protein [unclassified Nocardiopsis]|uniref:hypothetical protein n=1 Tax=Nocardiopsis TaxID=2013 RepID=UPI00387ADC7B